jgi:hypothetical protein
MSILRRLWIGAAAGAVATFPMSGVMLAASKARLLGEPPPKKITRAATRRLAPAVARHEAPLDLASIAAHLGFGAAMGALYSVALGRRRPTMLSGVAFGTAVWAVSYAGWVPAAGVMPEPSDDRRGRPASMVVSHWVFGASLASALRMLPR